MNTVSPLRITPIKLPAMAAILLFLLGIGGPRSIGSEPTLFAHGLTAQQQQPASPRKLTSTYIYVSPAKTIEAAAVLSVKDADLYRAAFSAQEKADWKAADAALAALKDKRLVGHILADRYLRRDITLTEARQWLDSYSSLSEAPQIYDQAQKLRGAKAAHLSHPVTTATWSGGSVTGNSFNFRATADASLSPEKARLTSRINAALRRGDPMAARELLETELQRATLTTAEAGDIISHIASAFFYQGELERAQPLAHMAASVGAPLGLWIDGLTAWKRQDYTTSARSFASLAQAPGLSSWDRSAAAFWGYRAAKRAGDETQARHWLVEAAKNPQSFYGYMAANISGPRPARSWKMPELTARSANLLAQYPAGWQALALVQVGKPDLAESELRRLNPAGKRDLQTASLALAESAHMPSLTVQLSGLATNDNGKPYEAASYPLPPWQPKDGFKVDRALIYALMKRESAFDPEAISQSGACGLMQLMPSTAHLMSHEGQNGSNCPDRLFDPSTNIELGQKYVRLLAGQPMIGNNLLLLLAAYNGGPGNLAHWIDDLRLGGEGRKDPLLFLESMPIRETRDYVQQVLMHYWMYRSRLAEPENSVAQLAHGEWPRYALNDNGSVPVRQVEAHSLTLASAGR